MRMHILKHTNIIISAIILIGFFIISFANYYTYSKVIKDDIENISKLTSSNIYAEINSELTKPIFVSLTMANDAFLKSWLREESIHEDDPAYIEKLRRYLSDLQKKYNYNSVFLVSPTTNSYYHFEGIHKKISPNNAHDVWYYAFLKSNKTYDLDVDVDEADNNTLTVFVNCRVEDADGRLMGVVGVGVKMRQLQSILAYFEKNFDLSAFLVNADGLAQVHTDERKIENAYMPALLPAGQYTTALPRPEDALRIEWYTSMEQENCLIIRYISQLEWYLVVDKNTSILKKSFMSLLFHDSLIIAVTIIALLMFCARLISSYNAMMTRLATTDELSGLMNRRAFRGALEKSIQQCRQHGDDCVLFIFDIDHFKTLNDTKGHLHGDALLRDLARVAGEIVGDAGDIARWGGDEFVGILHGPDDASAQILAGLLEAVPTRQELRQYAVTVSIGATRVVPSDTPDSLVARADEALYASKNLGRNRVTWR